ncbi:unnamed protein product, partial [marine sediment metagenome]
YLGLPSTASCDTVWTALVFPAPSGVVIAEALSSYNVPRQWR